MICSQYKWTCDKCNMLTIQMSIKQMWYAHNTNEHMTNVICSEYKLDIKNAFFRAWYKPKITKLGTSCSEPLMILFNRSNALLMNDFSFSLLLAFFAMGLMVVEIFVVLIASWRSAWDTFMFPSFASCSRISFSIAEI